MRPHTVGLIYTQFCDCISVDTPSFPPFCVDWSHQSFKITDQTTFLLGLSLSTGPGAGSSS